MASGGFKLFLSCVTDEFGDKREALRDELTSLRLDVAIQENFGALGVDTLSKLDAYIRKWDAVIHIRRRFRALLFVVWLLV